ncbi:MAG: hypothetical protein WC959_09175 [Kiritimatiellales bacterium]
MKKLQIIITAVCLCCSHTYSEIIYSIDFENEKSIPEQWICVNVGKASTIEVRNGTLRVRAAQIAVPFSQSYALKSGTKAKNKTAELWLRVHVDVKGDEDGAILRLGLGDSAIPHEQLGRHSSMHLKAFSSSSSLEFESIVQNRGGKATCQNVRKMIDVFCRLTDVRGQLQVDCWYNPANPAELGRPTVSKAAAYEPLYGSGVIDRFEINTWSTTTPHQIEKIVVGTTFDDVK